ncbi:DUF6124 family protein [Pseudomonas gingeri]|uniref:DUF6124 family protein n=2 Tax=Pseudomonas gingeri TaxID=117681 RepID=UPI0015A22163|nr:hypothetical protein [Pseudomonas gingeri]NWD06390.1 hypothetical protein [Pseudomonas gingeri]NWD49417.1 hypothetical protein [Pseudomonas gingeri]NWE30244.1 hypothetical protein [Pseudomonas gingeri]NWE32772.1 hypothetical protein [Pseudomonas gingeri]NWE60384.1 hypothetical protein [Pseudomonas gingeri]
MVKKITPDPPPCSTSSVAEKAAYLSKVMHDSLAQVQSKPPHNAEPVLLETLSTTAFRTVESEASSAPPLFSVQPGITAKVALTQVSELLRSAELNADEICPRLEAFERDLLMGLIHSVTLSRTVVDALLDGPGVPSHT